MMMQAFRNYRPKREHPTPKQPEQCQGCMWGSWNGTKQFCGRIKCVKGAKK